MKITAKTATTTYILPELRSAVAISIPVESCAKIEIETDNNKVNRSSFFIFIRIKYQVSSIRYQVSSIKYRLPAGSLSTVNSLSFLIFAFYISM